MEDNKLRIDFGSGYNPQKDYKTCDITYAPFLDYVYDRDKNIILDCDENSVDEFFMRNVVHHIEDLEETFSCIKRYLKENGTLKIVDARKEDFLKNVILDILWYRYVTPRYDIWFSTYYRDYAEVLEQMNFELIDRYEEAEKEISLWKKL